VESESYSMTSGVPWLVLEEEDDEEWRPTMDFTRSGSFYVYGVGYGEELACRGRFESGELAQAYVAQTDNAHGEWHHVPASVPPTLMSVLRWVQRELVGGAGGPWYERFAWIDPSHEVRGERSFARVFEGGVPTGVVVAAEHGHDDQAAAYLIRTGDAPRLVYTLERLDVLTAMLENYLGEAQLGEWRMIPDDWANDLGSLAAAVLVIAGLR
jgi:hypothetical protein